MFSRNFVALSTLAVLIISCGSGSPSGSSLKKTLPLGPISYVQVYEYTNTPINVQQPSPSSFSLNTTIINGANITFSDPITNKTNCVNPIQQMSYQSQIGEDTKIASFFGNLLSFIPVAGSVLSFGASAANFGIGQYLYNNSTGLTSCLAYSDQTFTHDFNIVQGEINNIESQITDINGEIQILLSDIITNARNIAGINNQTLSQADLYIVGSTSIDGMTQNFLKYSGLANQSGESTGASLLQMPISGYTDISTMVISDSTSYQIALMNATATQVNNSCTSNCFQYVSQAQNSALLLTYQSIYESYIVEIQQTLSNNQNIVPLIQNYNNSIVYLYQQSMLTLQSAYSIEFMINQANYFAAIRGIGAQYQIPSISNYGGTYYTYSDRIESTTLINQTNLYNAAQQQLSLVYSAKFNQLYINTIQYIMTDPAVAFQLESSQIAYYDVNGVLKSIYESNEYLENAGINVKTPISFTPGNSWKTKVGNTMGILYQFDGIRNPAICNSTLTNYIKNESAESQPFNSTSCPVLFNSSNGSTESGFYNGINLVPYVANYSTQKVILTESVNNIIPACNIGTSVGQVTGDFYFWMPSATSSPNKQNSAYLMCNYWNQQFNGTYNAQVANAMNGAGYLGEFNANGYNTFTGSIGGQSFSMTPLFSSDSSNVSAVDVLCYSYGESIPTMEYGNPLSMTGPLTECGNNGSSLWMGYPENGPITVAMQAELPFSDGFIAPIVLGFNINQDFATYTSMLYCNLSTSVTVNDENNQAINLCSNVMNSQNNAVESVTYFNFNHSMYLNNYGPESGPGFGFWHAWAFIYQ